MTLVNLNQYKFFRCKRGWVSPTEYSQAKFIEDGIYEVWYNEGLIWVYYNKTAHGSASRGFKWTEFTQHFEIPCV